MRSHKQSRSQKHADCDTTATFRWTRIIDSFGLVVPDEAHFEKLPNGDDLEIGITPCPHKDNVPTGYEEVWRDATAKSSATELSWILQSQDGSAFIGKIGAIYLAIQKTADGGFAARREDREASGGKWNVSYESGSVSSLPRATEAIGSIESSDQKWVKGQTVEIGGTGYIFSGVGTD